MSIIERWTRYALMVECRYCGDHVFHHESDARAEVKWIVESNGYDEHADIDLLRAQIEKTCDYCQHVWSKDD